MKLYIKYMVSQRCKMMVQSELDNLGIRLVHIELGMVEVPDNITLIQRKELSRRLLLSGLELLDDKRSILIERIKNVVVEMIHYSNDGPRINHSDYISEKVGYDYTYLSNIFSEVKGVTLQQFIIVHRIELVKELLLYDELTLTEIAYRLHYSSVAHLSNQFKKVTGLTPSFYRSMRMKRSQNLEDL